MTRAVLDVRTLGSSEWRVLREIRLSALCDAPHAFAAEHHVEQTLPDGEWRDRLRGGTWLVAVEHGTAIGLAGLVPGQQGEPHHVESIWVASTHRNRGVFKRLLGRIEDTARRAQLRHLWLWVLEDNLLAQQVYSHLGFRFTDERKLIDPVRQRFECRMRLTI